jgi:hypothetical protein
MFGGHGSRILYIKDIIGYYRSGLYRIIGYYRLPPNPAYHHHIPLQIAMNWCCHSFAGQFSIVCHPSPNPKKDLEIPVRISPETIPKDLAFNYPLNIFV